MTHEKVVPCPSCDGGWRKRGAQFGYVMCTACMGRGFIEQVSTGEEPTA